MNDGPTLIADIEAALSARFPRCDFPKVSSWRRKDVHYALSKFRELMIVVPGGSILVELSMLKTCDNMAELRAYIDSLEVR